MTSDSQYNSIWISGVLLNTSEYFLLLYPKKVYLLWICIEFIAFSPMRIVFTVYMRYTSLKEYVNIRQIKSKIDF